MVQRKEQPQPKIKLERPPSSHHQQQKDPRSKGVGDLKKKMKLERSMRAADLESLKETSALKHKRPSKPPNYMKPTSSSNAKKEKAQVNLRPLVKKNTLKGVILIKATCSSTMKDSKFPDFLELNHEGTSKMRVCPYTYCSLNGHGHGHENLPPLKCFMASKRKLLKTQKCMRLKSLKIRKNKEGIDTGQNGSFDEVVDDFFIEIVYNSKPKEEIMEGIVEEDVDQISEISNEEVDGIMSLLEYVECDQQVEESYGKPRVELVIENKASTLDFGLEEEFESRFLDNMTECSDLVHTKVDEDGDDNSLCDEMCDEQIAIIEDVNREANEDSDEISNEPVSMIKGVVNEGDGHSSKEVDEKVNKNPMQEEKEDSDDMPLCNKISDEPIAKTPNDVNQEADEEGDQEDDEDSDEISGEQIVGNKCVLDEGDGISLKEVNRNADKGPKEENEDGDDTPPTVEISNEPITPEQEEKRRIRAERIKKEEKENEVEKLILKITKKKIVEEETDDMREFNPRSPRFLEIEPDPEAEMVDLKHQEMEERKNSEEYLIDYALQRAVTKLGPARKQKVALLVEAFETVMPIQGLVHGGGIMQACI